MFCALDAVADAAAAAAAGAGLKTAVFSGKDVGGTCVNRGCVPSKALLAASGRVREMQDDHHLDGMGIKVHIFLPLSFVVHHLHRFVRSKTADVSVQFLCEYISCVAPPRTTHVDLCALRSRFQSWPRWVDGTDSSIAGVPEISSPTVEYVRFCELFAFSTPTMAR